MNLGHVRSQTETIACLCKQDIVLNIPSYQRPYVWPAEDITKLLDDIEEAQASDQTRYYIGTLLSARNAPDSYELIDGQQRCTTLFLLALALTRRPGFPSDHPLVGFIHRNNQPRLTFKIRHAAQAFLAQAAGLTFVGPSGDPTTDPSYHIHLQQGLKAINDRLTVLAQQEGKLLSLADYLYSQVVWVNNIVPAGMNLNRLFARINTAGVQLEQSDILKAQLLAKIADHSLKHQCDAIWQACENLSNFFERNVRQLFPLAKWDSLQFDDLATFDAQHFPLNPTVEAGSRALTATALTLAQLAAEATTEQDAPKKTQDATTDNGNVQRCRSIIGFPLLLMHAYRIFRGETQQPDIDSRLNATQLSKCFEDLVTKGNDKEAIAFVHCLWRVRYQFDRWVVKWLVNDGIGGEHLALCSVSFAKDHGRLQRSDPSVPVSELVQLQAVRHFTGERSAQYWLSPFLAKMMALPQAESSDALCVLEKIDNSLSLAQSTQKEASFALLQNEKPACHAPGWITEHLQQPLGTGFEHYWFQKLEYVLWKGRRRVDFPFLDEKYWQDFRIVSKNSVEHVHPQQHKHPEEQLEQNILDRFGNLALLSPGENSKYSNQEPEKKRVDFLKKSTYDSLKLAHIFHLMGKEDWNTTKMALHQQYMLDLLSDHYKFM